MSTSRPFRRSACAAGLLAAAGLVAAGARVASSRDVPASRVYENRLTPIASPRPLLADYPEFVEPVRETVRFEAPALVVDEGADLSVRAWRWCYNARGIIEIPNRLRGSRTALVVVHPWGIDDGQGWKSPEPAGVAFNCTPEKNRAYHRHVERILNPFLKAFRGRVALVAYSLPGPEDPIRKKVYRSIRGRPTAQQREEGARELAARLKGFDYRGSAVPERLQLSAERPVADYFRQFPGLDAGDRYNGPGFWNLPIPVVKQIELDPEDVVIYDAEGYEPLRQFLRSEGIRNVLLAGYATDMCLRATCAGYLNLEKDFNVFVVGDATQATFPANPHSRFATNAHLSYAALERLITQVSWVRPEAPRALQGGTGGAGARAQKPPR